METSITPKTYYGYDEKETMIASCSANDANEIVNPATVQAAIKEVEVAAENGTKAIAGALQSIESDASEAIIVQGTNMQAAIDEVCSAMQTISSSIVSDIGSVYDEAVRIHNELQERYNLEAKNAVNSCEGVVRVSG